MENYRTIYLLGKGACGEVYLAQHITTERLCALKKVVLDESKKSRTKEAVLHEAKILSSLKHPHIVAYLESFFDASEQILFIVQDFCDGGTLSDRINDAKQSNCHFLEKDIIQWFLQITLAVQYMHSHKVLHRDLKAENVFMDKSGTICKIGDFGISKSLEDTIDKAKTCVGTPCYLSPEMCQDIPYSSKADIWALGCMLYELAALHPAFDAYNLISLFYKIVKGEYEPIPDTYSADLRQLVDMILEKDPEKRPSARGILMIPFVKDNLDKFIQETETILEVQRRVSSSRLSMRPTTTSSHSTHKAERTLSRVEKRLSSCRSMKSTITNIQPSDDVCDSSAIKSNIVVSESHLYQDDEHSTRTKTHTAALRSSSRLESLSLTDRRPLEHDITESRKSSEVVEICSELEPRRRIAVVERASLCSARCLAAGGGPSRLCSSCLSAAEHGCSRKSSRICSADELSADYNEVYPDDFDECVDVDEENSNELTSKNHVSRLNMSNVKRASEVDEELPDGVAADDDFDLDSDEDEEIEELLDNVLVAARDACCDLETKSTSDDLVIDTVNTPRTGSLIKRHCMAVLGQEKYDQVTEYCENHTQPEIGNLEELVGRKDSETAYVVTRLISPSTKKSEAIAE